MTLNELILAVTGSLAASILSKATLVTVLALVTTRLTRTVRASLRHVVLSAAFAMLLALPVAAILAPSIPVAVPIIVEEIPAPAAFEAVTDALPAPAAVDVTSDAATPAIRRVGTPTTSAVLLASWAIGAMLSLLRIGLGLRQMRSLRRSAVPWPPGRSVARSLAEDAGVGRRVDVLLHESISGPMTCGVLRATIVLPMDAPTWAPEDLQRAVVHELEHVRRGDWASQCLARIVCAMYWFHPLMWIARRQLVLEAERACDDAVLRSPSTGLATGTEATAYADQLVGLAERLSTHPPLLAMANRHDLAARVVAVLDRRQARGRAGAVAVVFACAASALLVTTISPLRIVAEAQTAAVNAQRFEAASIKPCAAEALPPTQAGGRAAGPGNATTSPGRVHWECATLDQLVNTAYAGVDNRLLNNFAQQRPGDPRIVRGAPVWVYSDKFTVDAKAADDADRATLTGPMLRALLEDRFKVKTHRATEERSMYALTIAKGGLKIKPTAPGDCRVHNAVTQPTPPPGAENLPLCGNLNMNWNGGNRTLTSTGVTLEHFASSLLSGLMDRYVIDRTARDGQFNIPLEFVPDDSTPGGLSGLTWSRRDGATPAAGPSIFTALDELGLKLDRTKALAEYLVIDHVERPTPDVAPTLVSQTAPAGARQKFDAASIKPCAPEDPPPGTGGARGTAGGTNASISPGRFNVPCVTLEQLVYLAYASYGASADQLLANDYLGTASDATKVRGGPAWVHSTRDKYAIEATAPAGVSDRAILMGAMLRTLLEERFHLVIHRASEDVAMYALRLAKGGLKLKPMNDGDCDPNAGATPPPWTKQPCGFMTNARVGPNTHWRYVGFQLGFLARTLSGPLGRHVIDETGVPGKFVINLEFLTDDTATPDPSSPVPPAASIFTALEQQLGLKLDKVTGPRGYLVIDRAERPTPNAPALAVAARAAGPGGR